MKDEPGLDLAASLVLRRPQHMTELGRREVANWLRRQASALEKRGDQLASRYTARYWFKKDDDDGETRQAEFPFTEPVRVEPARQDRPDDQRLRQSDTAGAGQYRDSDVNPQLAGSRKAA
jgi:hypothetical protein